MSISFSPLFSQLRSSCYQVSSEKKLFQKLQHQQELLRKLHQEIVKELSSHEGFNWESHPTNRGLLDEIYDSNLIEDFEERTYIFSDTQKIMTFIQKIKTSIESKTSEAQKQQNLYQKDQQELMQFYHTLLELISKVAQCVAAFNRG